jgi:hypothetical protein
MLVLISIVVVVVVGFFFIVVDCSSIPRLYAFIKQIAFLKALLQSLKPPNNYNSAFVVLGACVPRTTGPPFDCIGRSECRAYGRTQRGKGHGTRRGGGSGGGGHPCWYHDNEQPFETTNQSNLGPFLNYSILQN